MNRQQFVKRGMYGLGALIVPSAVLQACTKLTATQSAATAAGTCAAISPSETKGPFPIKTPADLVKSNIVSDREGIPLLVNITIQNKNNNCQPLAGVLVDIWHCDAEGNYSEYGGMAMQATDYTNVHFLRGRQTTDAEGKVSFVSIYPGWYRGRAPHIHVEVLTSAKRSLLVTQIAFPEDTSTTVYATSEYNGPADTANSRDNVFADSLEQNMADAVQGNTKDGYTLNKTIIVSA